MNMAIAITTWHELGILPPAGTECEYLYGGKWHKVFVIGADPTGFAVFTCDFTDIPYMGCSNPAQFRPIRTPEQIAEEEREAAISEMAQVLRQEIHGFSTPEVVCAIFYDAGYRKLTLS